MIGLVSHQINWQQDYQELKDAIVDLLQDDLLQVDHFGSTSIPGIVAKPIIDIIGVVSTLAAVDERLGQDDSSLITNLGENGLAGRRYLVVFDGVGKVRAHVHLFEPGDSNYLSRLAFRDHLRLNPSVAKEYETLKIALAQRFPDDPTAYWNGKADFVNAVLQRRQAKM